MKYVKRSGWWVARIKDPETIAEHSHRTSIIAYFLGLMERADAQKCAMIAMFHETSETRINDAHKIAVRYFDHKDAEEKATRDQVKVLPGIFKEKVSAFQEEWLSMESKEAIIAKDADYLECAIQAREYFDAGYKDTWDWIKNTKKRLKTESAKRLLSLAEKTDSNSWWEGLKNR